MKSQTSQAHLQFTQAQTQPKITKELATPTLILEKENNETPTAPIATWPHLGRHDNEFKT